MVVGAENASVGVSGLHAALELREAARVDGTEGLDVHLASSSVWQATTVEPERPRRRSDSG